MLLPLRPSFSQPLVVESEFLLHFPFSEDSSTHAFNFSCELDKSRKIFVDSLTIGVASHTLHLRSISSIALTNLPHASH